MKVLRPVLMAFLVLIVLGIIAGSIFIRYTSRKSLPDYNKDIVLNGLSAEVKVIRDEMAVPHVYAENEADLYRAVGYLQAQDRLWQMDLLRRLTTGRLSEIFGRDLAGADQLFRSLHFTEKSEMVIDSCSEEVKGILDAYAQGVNDYIEENRGKLPPEFSILGYEPEKWEAVHSANLIGYMAWGLTMAWSTELCLFNISGVVDEEHFMELVPDMDYQDVYVIPGYENTNGIAFNPPFMDAAKEISRLGLQVFQASNNWVVSGEKSSDGFPMLANDMHLELNTPGIWYQMHQNVPGLLNVTGVVLPGQPFIIGGHNDDVAWGMTNVMVDDMDFYLETISETDSLKYLFNGEWKDLVVEKELILTKEGDSIVVYNKFTHRGPVVSGFKGIKGKVISMRWTGNEYSNELRSVHGFNRMKNWEEFQDAASTFIAVSQNIAYADRKGNIGMYISAGVPLREGQGVFIVPGDTSLYDWTGLVPFKALPHSFNPPEGYIASANNRTIGDEYPYYISRWFDLPNRMERIVEGLVSREKISMEDMMAIQSDQHSRWAEKLLPWFIGLLEPGIEELDSLEKTCFRMLSEWDFHMPAESVESSLFEQFYVEFIASVFKDEMGEELYKEYISQDMLAGYFMDKVRLTGKSIWFDNVTTGAVESPEEIALQAFQSAVVSLTKRLGGDTGKWQWGKIHSLSLNHPLGSVDVLNKAFKLNRGPFAVGGSYHTVSPYSYPFDDLFHANHGSSHRHLFSTSDWDKSLVIIPTGISGIPASRHYCDQTQAYLKYEYKADAFSEAGVKSAGRYEMKFSGKTE